MGGGGTNTVTENADPWEGVQPYLTDLFSQAQNAYGAVPKTPFQGQMVAEPSQYSQQGADMAALLAQQIAQGQYTQGTQAASNYLQQQLTGGAYTPEALPTFADYDISAVAPVIEAGTRPLFEQYTEQSLPQLQSQAINSGAFSGSKAVADLPQILARDFNRSLLDTAAQVGFEDFQSYRDLIPKMGQLELMAAETVPRLEQSFLESMLKAPELLGAAGAQETAIDQAIIDNELAQWREQIEAPFRGLNQYASALGQGGQFYSQTTETPGPSGVQNFLSGALGGVGLASGLGSALGEGATASFIGGPWGMAIGGLIGGLGSLL